jgi:hypothetical protein
MSIVPSVGRWYVGVSSFMERVFTAPQQDDSFTVASQMG